MLNRLAAFHKPTAVLLLAAAMLTLWGLTSQRLGGADRSLLDSAPASAAAVPTDADNLRFQIEHWDERSRQNDLDYLSRTNLAVAELALGRLTGDFSSFDSAEAPLREALELNPAYSPTLSTLAAVHLGRHEFVDALSIARLAYDNDPTSDEALAVLGDAHLELGNYPEAETAFRTLARRQPGSTSEARLARLAFLKGQPDEAIERATLALESAGQPADASYRAALAAYALDAGEIDLAADVATEALAERPDSSAALETLAQVRAMQGDLERAAELYERLLEDGPDPGAHDALTDIYSRLDRHEDAERHRQQVEPAAAAITSSPLVFDRDIAMFLADNGLDPERAVAIAERDLERRQDIYAYDTLAWARHAAGDFDGAGRAMEQALALGTVDPHLDYRAGVIAAANGNAATARDHLRRALAINPNFDTVYAPHAIELLSRLEER